MSEFRRRLMMAGGGEEPISYQQIEYLEGDGEAYIDLGVTTAEISPIMEGEFYNPKISSNTYICGADGGGNTRFSIGLLTYNRIEFRIGNYKNISGQSSGWYTFTLNGVNGEAWLNGTLRWTSTILSFGVSEYISIFRRSGWKGGVAGVRFKKFKLYDNTELLFDLVPVRIGQVGYMYNKVNGELLGNAADSGAFILGNDVN